jgi:hypothetical protein
MNLSRAPATLPGRKEEQAPGETSTSRTITTDPGKADGHPRTLTAAASQLLHTPAGGCRAESPHHHQLRETDGRRK